MLRWWAASACTLLRNKYMRTIFTKRFFAAFAALFLVLAAQAQNYYEPVNNLKGGETLKNALHQLLKEHKVISYGSGATSTWGAFYTTDVVPGTKNQVADMYSNTVRYFGEKGEAVQGMNIEHSVAKSWWGGSKVDAYYDLHHLNPSDANANTAKSNYPLAELDKNEKLSFNNGVTFVGKATIDGKKENAYEPCDKYKGDFARVFMYMFTCYQDYEYKYTWMNYACSTYPTLKPWAVELLLKWHEQDPVSEKEVARNNAVYAIQGNRNPFIDFPQLAHYVWGDSVDYTFTVGDSYFEGVPDDLPFGTYLLEDFSSDFGDFATVEIAGDYPWSNKYGCAYVSAYDAEQKINNAAESWLVSPSLNLSKAGKVSISFEYLSKYNESGTAVERNCLMVSDNYNGDVAAATWRAIDFSIKENSVDYSFTSSGEILMPAEYIGCENVTIAFKYVATAAKAGTFEVKNLVVKEYEGSAGGGGSDNGDDGDDNAGESDENVSMYEHFVLLTDAAALAAGDSAIIAYNTFVMGEQSSNYREKLDGAVVNGRVLQSWPAGTQILIIENGTKDNTFAFNAGGQYLAAVSSGKNYLRSQASLTDDASWAVTIASDGAATIVSQGQYSKNSLQYNASSPRFSCYSSTQEKVKIYVKKVGGVTSVPIIFAGDNGTVDVYNLYGVCVKKGADASDPLQNLPAGMYIVNGKKVFKRN